MICLALAQSLLAVPNPEFQEGGDGHHEHHHDHHAHDEGQKEEQSERALDNDKNCKLVRESKPRGKLCFNEPECGEVCTPATKKVCKNVQEEQCQERIVKSCSTVVDDICTQGGLKNFQVFCISA